MAGSTAVEPPAWPVPGPFDTRAGFEQAVQGLLLNAEAQGVRRLLWASEDPLVWPLESTAVLAALAAWARPPGHEWVWLGADFEPLRSRMPRLVRWRQTWDHRLRCLAPAEPELLAGRQLLIAEGRGVLLLVDARHWRGLYTEERQELHHVGEWFDAVMQRSAATFPVTTLGI